MKYLKIFLYIIQKMTDIESFGWGCYWKLRANKQRELELIDIIKRLGGDKELDDWLKYQQVKEDEKEKRRLKRELKKLKI